MTHLRALKIAVLAAGAVAILSAFHSARGGEVPVPPNTVFRFEFSTSDVNTIEAGLNELPRKYSEPLIQKMRSQVTAEAARRAEEARKAEEAKRAEEAKKAEPPKAPEPEKRP